MGVGIVAPQRQRAVIAADGARPLLQVGKSAAAVELRLGKIAAHRERTDQETERAEGLAGPQERECDVIERLGKSRVEGDRTGEEGDGACKRPAVNMDEAGKVERIDVEGFGEQHRVIAAERLLQTPLAVGSHAFSQTRCADLPLSFRQTRSARAHVLGLYRAGAADNGDALKHQSRHSCRYAATSERA